MSGIISSVVVRAGLGVAAAAVVAGGLGVAGAPVAQAAGRDGSCDAGEFCYSFNSDWQGSKSDFTGSEDNYGTDQPSCYDFKSAGNGQGQCIKNQEAAVWNRTGHPVRVFVNSGFGGASLLVQPGAPMNLPDGFKNNVASHRFEGGANPAPSGSNLQPGQFVIPFPCGEDWVASTWSGHNPANSIDWNHYPNDMGQEVYAAAPGTVVQVVDLGNRSYGKFIVIDHGAGWKTRYAHLSAQNVSVGQHVTEKSFIGRVGNTGTQSPHLHFEQIHDGAVVKAHFINGSPVYLGKTTMRRTSNCPA